MKVSEIINFVKVRSQWASENCSKRTIYNKNGFVIIGNRYTLGRDIKEGDYVDIQQGKNGLYKLISVNIDEITLNLLKEYPFIYNKELYENYCIEDDIGIRKGEYDYD